MPKPPSLTELLALHRPLCIAHRGNSSAAPENTLPAIRSALSLGVDLVEIDYRHAADGVPVLFHDQTLRRTTNAQQLWGAGDHRLDKYTLEQLAQLDAGAWFSPDFAGTRIPTLEEALTSATPQACVMIEHKSGSPRVLVNLLGRLHLASHVIVCSFDWHFLIKCRRQRPELALGALGHGPLDPEQLKAARRLRCQVIGWSEKHLRQDTVEAIREGGWHAWAWTVDDPQRARLLVGWGVTGLVTNNPAALLPVLREEAH
jgi:glycerophosphoryl diester phosphodiesterase